MSRVQHLNAFAVNRERAGSGLASGRSVSARVAGRLKGLASEPEAWLFVAMLLALAEVGWLSVARYRGYNAGMFDLGIMSQAIWSASQGQPLLFTAHGIAMSRLARHVEVFYFVPAPLYRLLPSPETLLLFQAVLYVAGAWPVYALARGRLSSGWLALAFAVVYLLYPVAQTAVLFDFHGDTLAMPFLMFALEALDRRAWGGYGLWLMLSLSCKFYVAVPVAALGVVCWLKGERRAGVWTTLTAVAWGAVAFLLIRSAFAPTDALEVRATPASYVGNYFSRPSEMVSTAGVRFLNAIIIYGPALWLGWRALQWLLPASAVALPALISSGPGPSFDYRYHHYALAVPFLIAAAIYGAERLRARSRDILPMYVGAALGITLMYNAAFVDSPLNPRFYKPPSGRRCALSALSYGVTERDRFKDEWLARYVPRDSPLAADVLISAHLANRDTLYLTRPPRDDTAVRSLSDFASELDYVVTDALLDHAVGSGGRVQAGGVLHERQSVRFLLESGAFGLLRADDGLLLFERGATGLTQTVETIPFDQMPDLEARFGDLIGLADTRLEALGESCFRLTCDWIALSSLDQQGPFFAVSRPTGLEHARVVHLPTYALLPTPEWPARQLIRERFEFALPDGTAPGKYPLVLSWHDGTSLFAANTDQRSRLGKPIQIGVIEVEK